MTVSDLVVRVSLEVRTSKLDGTGSTLFSTKLVVLPVTALNNPNLLIDSTTENTFPKRLLDLVMDAFCGVFSCIKGMISSSFAFREFDKEF